MKRVPYVVLGAGVAGLAAGWELGDRAIVVERDSRPGGLVRTERRGDYWFDRVLHLLYFPNDSTAARIQTLPGLALAPCPPEAWVESRSGITRFPFQMHLGSLPPDVIAACLRDLAACTFGPRETPRSFEALLLATFGQAMCDEFLLPYNRKVWKRDLATLAPSGFQWNITPPDFLEVVRGALSNRTFGSYNANGWYPRPHADAPVRGMELLSRQLATRVCDLRLEHHVRGIDVTERVVHVETPHGTEAIAYDHGVITTLPLPTMIELCDAPAALRERCAALRSNRVRTVAIAYAGQRPTGRGHWRYYSDETLCFSRLVYLHEFDPLLAPANGFAILAELVEPAEFPVEASDLVVRRVIDDIARCGGVPEGSEVVDTCVIDTTPAYVVFDEASRRVVEDSVAFLTARQIHAVGRYGRWEYSSMGQVMRDGFALGAQLRGAS